MSCILFVDFDFLFQFFGAFLERLPLFPVPPLRPLAFSLAEEPLDIGWVAERDFCFATLIFCHVLELQYGQYLFVSLGNFISNQALKIS